MNSKSGTAPNEQIDLGLWEIIILFLSIYVLGALLVQTAFQLPANIDSLLDRIDFVVCGLFLVDFVIRLNRAPSKAGFMKWGWIDLIASIPAVDFLRWGRLFRLIRIVRLLRAFRSARHVLWFLYQNRTKSLAGTAFLASIVLLIFSSIAILSFETDPQSNIKTSFDAIWWAFTTMTTVGYGDKYPVTAAGRVVAIVLMVTGVGLFGVLTGLFARFVVEPELKGNDSDVAKLAEEIRLLREKIEEMDKATK